MDKKYLPIILLGAGGASKEVYYNIKQTMDKSEEDKNKFEIIGFSDKEQSNIGKVVFDNQRIITCDDNINEYMQKYDFWGAVIAIGDSKIKKTIYEKLSIYEKACFPNIIHHSVIYEKTLMQIDCGNIISAGTVISCDIKIGKCNLININCTLGHDIEIGSFNTINPMTCISGNVKIGDGCLIGAGSTILQGVEIGNGAVIGAGAVVTQNVKKGATVVGVPAREIGK